MGQFDCKGWLACANVIEIINTVGISEHPDSNDCLLVLTKQICSEDFDKDLTHIFFFANKDLSFILQQQLPCHHYFHNTRKSEVR